MLEDRFGIDDCYPYERRWCVNRKGLNLGGVGRVGCVIVIVFFGVWLVEEETGKESVRVEKKLWMERIGLVCCHNVKKS
jgi:hypothetical protein